MELHGFFPRLRSARPHANGAVEADRLSVEIVVADDLQRQRAELVIVAGALGKRHLLAENVQRLLRQAHQQRRVEDARRDRADAHAPARQIARRRQRQIGSASCRESVCQYVLISVVDGFVKKKKTDSDYSTWNTYSR